jgi:hypothetical protein
MTRATTTIPFSTIRFINKFPRLSDLTERVTHKLRQIISRSSAVTNFCTSRKGAIVF